MKISRRRFVAWVTDTNITCLGAVYCLKIVSVACLMLHAVGQLWAQIPADPRIEAIGSNPGQKINLGMRPDRVLTVLVPPGEYIESVVVNDTQTIDVAVPESRDGFAVFVRNNVIDGGIAVRTDHSNYQFDISTTGNGRLPWVVRIQRSLSPPAAMQPSAADALAGRSGSRYRVTGARSLRPSSIRDDNNKTYINWPVGQAVPAVFGLGAGGDEEMVDGYVRDGTYVIDRTYRQLIFRMDRSQAKAHRMIAKSKP